MNYFHDFIADMDNYFTRTDKADNDNNDDDDEDAEKSKTKE